MILMDALILQVLQLVFEISVHRTTVEVIVFHLSDDLLKFTLALAQKQLHGEGIRFHQLS